MDTKRQKLLDGQSEMDQREDRISRLPDSLIHRILCFLPTKSVVRTSVLSKKWRYKWISIPNLVFRNWRSAATKDVYLETDRFMNFMDRILHLRDNSKLKKFYLQCDQLCDRTRVNAWVSAVVRCKVEDLLLCSKSQVPYSPFLCPSSIFTCDSLVSLTIDMHFDLKLPTLIHFPRLKMLQLKHIAFRDKNFPEKFISNCPVLEELSIAHCTWEMMEDFTISSPCLKTLTCIDPPKGVIKIDAPSVRSFTYTGRIAKEYDVRSFSSLVHAEIDFSMHLEDINDIRRRKEELAYAVTKLFERLSRVRSLKISVLTHKALSLVDNLNARLPEFKKLKHLEVSYKCSFQYFEALLCLLKMSPNLESVNFIQGIYGRDSENVIGPVMPPILFSKLKKVRFGYFEGHEKELILVEFMLKNASVLRKMVIHPLIETRKKKMSVKERILMFQRSSPKCKIVFSNNRPQWMLRFRGLE